MVQGCLIHSIQLNGHVSNVSREIHIRESVTTSFLTTFSGADSMGHGGTCPHFYKCLGTMGTVSRRTANKKLTKLYWPSRKRSPKRLIVLLEPIKWRGTTKIFSALRAGPVPPTFAPDWCPPLSNSFRRYWLFSVVAVVLPVEVCAFPGGSQIPVCGCAPTSYTTRTSNAGSRTKKTPWVARGQMHRPPSHVGRTQRCSGPVIVVRRH